MSVVNNITLADATPLIWLIIFVVITIAKNWSKFAGSSDENSSANDDGAPPTPRPKPQPPVQRPRVQPRPLVTSAPAPRGSRMQQPMAPRARPSTAAAPVRGQRRPDAEQLRRLVGQLAENPPVLPSRPMEPPPAATAKMALPEPEATPAPPPSPAGPEPMQRSRASQWRGALLDRQNVRNIIIGAEVIGPPKAESV